MGYNPLLECNFFVSGKMDFYGMKRRQGAVVYNRNTPLLIEGLGECLREFGLRKSFKKLVSSY